MRAFSQRKTNSRNKRGRKWPKWVSYCCRHLDGARKVARKVEHLVTDVKHLVKKIEHLLTAFKPLIFAIFGLATLVYIVIVVMYHHWRSW
jgi:hypothetical protein